jgi:hypothetical protein
MSTLGDVRDTIAEDLATDTGLQALGYVPGRIVPPLYVVTSGSPYLESGDTYGTFKAHFNVDVISATAANDVSTEQLDNMIEDALVSLVNSGIGIENVQQPFQLDTNNAQYLSTTITVNKTISL